MDVKIRLVRTESSSGTGGGTGGTSPTARADGAGNAAAARHARFGALPERIRYEDMVQVEQVTSSGLAGGGYDPEASWEHYSCLALDLGL